MKKDQVLFAERQAFRQVWIWILLIPGFLLTLFGLFHPELSGKPAAEDTLPVLSRILLALVPLAVAAFMYVLRLETEIRPDGIRVRFFPFHTSFRHYPWEDISQYGIRTYRPLSEYGGWGLRTGFFGRGTAYNVSGNKGLQLEMTNGKKLLIGTAKPEEMAAALERRERMTIEE